MKIYKSQYGYSTSAFSKNQESGTENKYYINVQFKKGTEPTEDVLEGELIFKEKDGKERSCFLSSFPRKDGTLAPKLIVMGEPSTSDTHNVEYDDAKPAINEIEIKPEELPFY